MSHPSPFHQTSRWELDSPNGFIHSRLQLSKKDAYHQRARAKRERASKPGGKNITVAWPLLFKSSDHPCSMLLLLVRVCNLHPLLTRHTGSPHEVGAASCSNLGVQQLTFANTCTQSFVHLQYHKQTTNPTSLTIYSNSFNFIVIS